MQVHYLQHVPFEGLGSIEPWLKSRSAIVTCSKLYETPGLPPVAELDWLIVLGGPMSADDDRTYPWLTAEKQFIAEAIASGKVALGICLGAQLIARSLGARVYRNRETEIGWFPVYPAPDAGRSPLAPLFSEPLEVFHWHGDTFELPPGAVHLARSAACEHQAFSIGDRVLALQFHLETTPASAAALIEHCGNDLASGRWIQTGHEMLGRAKRFGHINDVMTAVLESLRNS